MKSTSALIAASFCLPFSCGVAIAAPVVGASFPSSITVTEDGGTHTIDYLLTNNSGGSVTINAVQSTVSGTMGDPTDLARTLSVDTGTCGTLAPLATCTGHLNFTVDNGAGETDADFGQFQLNTIFGNGNFVALTADLVTTVTVSDVPAPIVGAGLPGLILASGGLLGWWRRRKIA